MKSAISVTLLFYKKINLSKNNAMLKFLMRGIMKLQLNFDFVDILDITYITLNFAS